MRPYSRTELATRRENARYLTNESKENYVAGLAAEAQIRAAKGGGDVSSVSPCPVCDIGLLGDWGDDPHARHTIQSAWVRLAAEGDPGEQGEAEAVNDPTPGGGRAA